VIGRFGRTPAQAVLLSSLSSSFHSTPHFTFNSQTLLFFIFYRVFINDAPLYHLLPSSIALSDRHRLVDAFYFPPIAASHRALAQPEKPALPDIRVVMSATEEPTTSAIAEAQNAPDTNGTTNQPSDAAATESTSKGVTCQYVERSNQ